MEKSPFYNIKLNIASESLVLDTFTNLLEVSYGQTLYFLNAHCFNVAQKNVAYKVALENSNWVLNDGIGINLAGKVAGIIFPDNLNGTDLIPKIIELGYGQNKSFYFLGTKTEVLLDIQPLPEKKGRAKPEEATAS